jgi:hypothetical protein
MKKKLRWPVLLILATAGWVSACTAWENELGQGLLPAGDRVFLFHDTIFEIKPYTVPGLPIVTSDVTFSESTVYMLGTMQDTAVGISSASIFTQFNTAYSFQPAPNPLVDSIYLYLYIPEVHGDSEEEFHIRLYEATQRTYMDSLYYWNMETEGAYNPELLAEHYYMPDGEDTLAILIHDLPGAEAFRQKFLDLMTDSIDFNSDSLFKEHFNGLYITAESAGEKGAIAEVALSDLVSRLTMRYANDSTNVDSTAGPDYTWATFPIDQYLSQKVNVFEHDYQGTYLEGIINDSVSDLPYTYIQGLGGVNTKLAFNDLEKWLNEQEGARISVSSADLVFEILPDSLSGIAHEDLPDQMMLYMETSDGELDFVYDYRVLYQQEVESLFGGQLEGESRGIFFDTTYHYRFDITLHFQYLVDNELDITTPYRVRLKDQTKNVSFSKIWSNLPEQKRRIRLELVYVRLDQES